MNGSVNKWMKSKLTIAVVVAALAGSLAYWLGYIKGNFDGGTRTADYFQDEERNKWRNNGYHQAWICLGALTNLHEGKQAETQAILEEHLNEGISRLVSSWPNPRGEQCTLPQILLVDAARRYRLQHPWTSEDAERVERVEKAFKMLDAPDQVKRLENIKKVLGPAR